MLSITVSNSRLPPAIPGRRGALFPQQEKVDLLAGGCRDFQNHPAAVVYDLGRKVDDEPAQRGGIAGRLKHRGAHILLERLEQEERNQHCVIEGGVGRKALEGQLLEAKILQPPVHQLIAAPAMIGVDNSLRLDQFTAAGLHQPLVHGLAHAQVGVKDRVGPGKREQHLGVFIKRPAKDGPAKALPAVASAAEGQILPHLPPLLMAAPLTGRGVTHVVFNRLVELATADIADFKPLEDGKQLLVEKTGIHTQDDRHIGFVVFPDFGHHVADHLRHGIPVVAVGIAAAKDGIDHKAFPAHLKRLKALDLLVGGPHPVAHARLVVVHHHGVYTQNHHGGGGKYKPPQKKPLQKMAEQIDAWPPEPLKKAFYRMGGEQITGGGLRGAGIASVSGKRIKMHQVPAGAVHEKAEQLLEHLADGLPLAATPQGTEKGLQLRVKSYAAQVANEKAQAPSAGQGVGGDLRPVNESLAFGVRCGKFVHLCPHPLGLQRDWVVIASTTLTYHNPLHSGWGFLCKIAQLRYYFIQGSFS
jgi:hypothetical protein